MHDARVSIHAQKLFNPTAPALGNSGNVISCKIDQHDVLCDFFCVRSKLKFQSDVEFVIDAAIGSETTRTCACDWANGDGVGLCRMQERGLGGSSEKFEVFSPDVEHVGTGVLIAQETVAGQRVGAFSDETA